jgi:hypothetical protein
MIKLNFYKFLVAFSLTAPLLASGQSLPQEVEAVRNYLLNSEYPEVFAKKQYPVTVENFMVADLDGDGVPEVIAHMKPHFRQSPTIVIFRVGTDLLVKRVTEGLAPGPLQSLSGKYLDSHAEGEGVDFQATTVPGANADADIVQAFVKSKGGLVRYKHFAHLDGREGLASYIDMRETSLPPSVKTCEDFEFADVEHVEITQRFSTDGRNVIAARVGKQVYAIRIERFLPNGLLEKSVTVHGL